MEIDYVLFDWGGTLGISHTRQDFLKEKNKKKKLKYLQNHVLSVLNKLYKKGIPMGILSNTSVSGKAMRKGIKEAGLDKYFTVQVYSSNNKLECGKPCDDIYEHTIQLINKKHPHVKRENILYVGDSFIADVIGAWNVGMKTAYLVNEDWIAAGMAYLLGWQDAVLFTMKDLAEKLK